VPSTRPTLTRDDARRLVADRGFGRDDDTPAARLRARNVGIELEWLAVRLDAPGAPAPFDVTCAAVAALGTLPGASACTFEPGGQVELSTPPLPLAESIETAARDAAVLGDELARHGVGLVAVGLEPGPRRPRVVRAPRYDAMEAFFDVGGSAGRTMMRSTASLQVNLDLGDPIDASCRWRAAHDLGPMLAAMFANSPFGADGPSGYRSTRLAVWRGIDESRTGTVDDVRGADCRRAWIDYVFGARVMQICASDEHHEAVLEPLTFGAWLDGGHPLGWPTADDLEYHLTTLFPPVRPRGWLELRMLDAVPAPWWRVAVALTDVLVHDDRLRNEVERASTTRDLWSEAARDALSHPALGAAALECIDAALVRLPDTGADDDTVAAAAEFRDRYTARGRTPADDLLDVWRATGSVLLPCENRERARA
jgi:glutamate--cysteine ligase